MVNEYFRIFHNLPRIKLTGNFTEIERKDATAVQVKYK